jgi:hypothetical protein
MNKVGHVLWLPPNATISKYMKFIPVNCTAVLSKKVQSKLCVCVHIVRYTIAN